MRTYFTILFVALLASGFTKLTSFPGTPATGNSNPGADTITCQGYTLIINNLPSGFDTSTLRRLIDVFFEVYPRQVQRFNTQSAREVLLTIDPQYPGVAEASGNKIRISSQWLKNYPEDLDVITHEAMHIVQSYTHPVPGWLTEGIADYVRYAYGINNLKGNWLLPDFQPDQHYTNAYRITARFFIWLEKNVKAGLVDSLDKAARAGTYAPQLWTTLTGKTVDDLWQEYGRRPRLELSYR
jgi:Plant Basic Secretory Protein.